MVETFNTPNVIVTMGFPINVLVKLGAKTCVYNVRSMNIFLKRGYSHYSAKYMFPGMVVF